jgi:DNA-binding MarR family transcriptional regulator
MPELDRVIHEQARLAIVTLLATVEEADFLYLLQATELTKGNLSAHLARLEAAGYVEIEKAFRGKIPMTLARLTPEGLAALKTYRKEMTALLNLSKNANKGLRKRSRVAAVRPVAARPLAAPQRA